MTFSSASLRFRFLKRPLPCVAAAWRVVTPIWPRPARLRRSPHSAGLWSQHLAFRWPILLTNVLCCVLCARPAEAPQCPSLRVFTLPLLAKRDV